jgi:nitrate reductase delta subunit
MSPRTLRAFATLLSYPEPGLLAALPAIREALRGETRELLDELAAEELYVLQERYVALFDRSRALSLHLFEHVHGESRDRGQAMVDLAAMYAARGLQVSGRELPDYLPAFLEFLSLLPQIEARAQLAETARILRSLGDNLARRGSRYAGVFEALLGLAGEPGLSERLAPRAAPGEEDSPEAIEKAWMDEPVTFGGAAPAAQPVRFYPRGTVA